MNQDGRILETICRIRQLCVEIESLLGGAKSMGRMPSLEEARKADALSMELMEQIQALPPDPCGLIESLPVREIAAETLNGAGGLLKKIVSVPATSRQSVTTASAMRLKAYAAFR